MTEKQISILESALELFSSKGFDAVPTSLIAKQAGVSEGLIFRHFKNKQGLLNAIVQMGKEKIAFKIQLITEIVDPQKRIQAIMEIPFSLETDQYPLWRLIYSLKWQQEYSDDEFSRPIKEVLVNSLNELKYFDADAEADLIMSYMDGFASTILLKGEVVNKDKLLHALRKKY
ncbi:TetR/AcrR family transcriptional regulator [Bacteroidia bacterium]|nr:TetR/AcrR family transcriptional regulator [Bacteroidia bacterium]MDB9882584.1 TetR/AcrR family transcriptional regulator [Bacteroidia bacterium]MDC1395459.1 TetR/AcrR family transcriptional regulator [Bacteroidia bacterium]